MAENFATLQEKITELLIEENANKIYEGILPKVENMILNKFGGIPEAHVIYSPKGQTELKEVTHEKFEEVLNIVSLNIPVYLTGQAGTGKNVICKQVAKALGLDFYFTNAVTQEYKLTGFIDANGVYQETQFYKAFTEGGLFFLDEMDASVPEVLIILNAAIANKYFDFPIGKVEAHPDFRVIAAGNTVGTGADVNYTGRYCLDRASLDRFAMIEINYSEKIEKNMSHGKLSLIDFAHGFRKATKDANIECLFSYRTLERIALLEDVIPDLFENIQISLLKGLSEDDLTMVCKQLSRIPNMDSNRYAKVIIDHCENLENF